jgi:hypothetical protein
MSWATVTGHAERVRCRIAGRDQVVDQARSGRACCNRATVHRIALAAAFSLAGCAAGPEPVRHAPGCMPAGPTPEVGDPGAGAGARMVMDGAGAPTAWDLGGRDWSIGGAGGALADVPAWGSEESRSYLIPAIEIVGFQVVLNLFDRHFVSESEFGSTLDSTQDNLESGWVMDQDPFEMNQLGHPYSGAIYHNFARSAGLGYWEAFAYDFVASAVWEVAGENTKPSLNDQITTSVGGSFVGEALFRTASWILEQPDGRISTGREIGAALVSPPTGFNRLVSERFRGVFPSHDATVFSRLEAGGTGTVHLSGGGPGDHHERDAFVGWSVDYGLPSRGSHEYTRPFDYFHFQGTLTSDLDNAFNQVLVRGLLFGSKYECGASCDGVYGLYGNYDYVSPGLFQVATTGLSFGTTAQVGIVEGVTLQGTALAGAGFGAAGSAAEDSADRDYHYGGIPQALIDLRLIAAEVVMLDLGARDYYVIGGGGSEGSGQENIAQVEAAVVVRIYGRHAVGVHYIESWRSAAFEVQDDKHQNIGTVLIAYNLLNDTRFGVAPRR